MMMRNSHRRRTGPPGASSVAGHSDPGNIPVRPRFSRVDVVDRVDGRQRWLTEEGPGAGRSCQSSDDADRRGCHAQIFFLRLGISAPFGSVSNGPHSGRRKIRSRNKGLAGHLSASSPYGAENGRFVFGVAPGGGQISGAFRIRDRRHATRMFAPNSEIFFWKPGLRAWALQARGLARASQCSEHAVHAASPITTLGEKRREIRMGG